jgi:hypothetical protein
MDASMVSNFITIQLGASKERYHDDFENDKKSNRRRSKCFLVAKRVATGIPIQQIKKSEESYKPLDVTEEFSVYYPINSVKQ